MNSESRARACEGLTIGTGAILGVSGPFVRYKVDLLAGVSISARQTVPIVRMMRSSLISKDERRSQRQGLFGGMSNRERARIEKLASERVDPVSSKEDKN